MELTESELLTIQDALFAYMHSLDATGPTFDRDVDAALALKGRVTGELDSRLIAAGVNPHDL